MTPSKQRALAALLASRSQIEAAEMAHLDPRTLRRYLQDPDFAETYRRELAKLIDSAAAQAKRALCPTLGTLQEITKDAGQPGSVRVSAARAVLEFGIKLIEQSDILTKLDKLENQLMGGEKDEH